MEQKKHNPLIDAMFKAGAHFGYARSRRHPTAAPFIFGVKNRVEIFDLEKTSVSLENAKAYLKSVAAEGKKILFVGNKTEAREAIRREAMAIEMPFVALRWVGGSLTNFDQIRKRIEKFEDLTMKREKGELSKYTKKERLLIDREITNLDKDFSGIVSMKELPAAIVLVDAKKEYIALEEAKKIGIPVVAICGADCDLKQVEYPIPANDASKTSVDFLVKELAHAYREGVKAKTAPIAPIRK
jgi:small subunit ribosomal protein S2